MQKIKTLSVALLATATLAATPGCVSERRNGDEPISLPQGAPMPRFSVTGPDGTTLTDADLRGTRTVVALFRTTCPDCSREMPGVEEAHRRLSAQNAENLRFIAISKEDDHATKVPEYWAATGMTMPYFFDPAGEAFAAFEVRFVPTLYLFGSDGLLAHAEVETFEFTVDELVKKIEELK